MQIIFLKSEHYFIDDEGRAKSPNKSRRGRTRKRIGGLLQGDMSRYGADLSVFQQSWPELPRPCDGLLVLPFPYEFRISAEQHVRDFPAVEFCRSGVDRG